MDVLYDRLRCEKCSRQKRVERERKEIADIEDKWAMNPSLLLLFQSLYRTPYIRYYGIRYAALHARNIISRISVVQLSVVSR